MKFLISLFIIFLLISCEFLISQNQPYNVPSRKKKEVKESPIFIPDFEAQLSFSYHTSSGFFDKNGKLVSDLPDTVSFPGVPRQYTFDLNRYTFDFDFKYFATSDITLNARFPVTFYFLDEIFLEYLDIENQKRYMREYKERLSHTRIDYFGLTAMYSLSDSKFINKYFAEIRIPSGNHDGIRNDTRELWSDGALEFLPGFLVGFATDKATVEIGAKYNYRGEDMTDRVMGNLNMALHTVPGTRFYGFVEACYNVTEGDDNYEFNIRQMPWQDEYLDAGVGFKFVVEQLYIGDFSYRIRIDGKNAWNHAAYFINFGYRF